MASELFKSGQPGTDCQANCHLSAPTELRQFPTCPDRQAAYSYGQVGPMVPDTGSLELVRHRRAT